MFNSDVKENPRVQNFRPGDTVKVGFKISESGRERVQAFQGVVLRKRGGGLNATFTVRRIAANVGVERVFPLYSPLLESLEVLRRGDVRRARLYYLRGLTGKAARIKERSFEDTKKDTKEEPEASVEEAKDTKEEPKEESSGDNK